MRRGLVLVAVLLSASAAQAQTPDFDRARRHFEAGTAAFRQGDYPRAELEFRAAFAITRDPVLHYNIGQAQQRRGHLEAAVKSFRAYLAGVPNAEDKAEVEQLIASIEKELERPKMAPTPPPRKEQPVPLPAPAPKGEDLTARRQSAWVVGGVSLAFVGAGVAMSVLSWQKAQDANEVMDQRVAGIPLSYASVQAEFDGLKTDAATFGGVAIGMYAAAAVGAGIATYLFVTSRPAKGREQREARFRLVPVLGGRNAGLHAGMEF